MAAARAYFDSSVLVKRYVREKDSRLARLLVRRYGLLSSVVTPLELISALARRRLTGELTPKDFAAVLSRLERDRAFWELVEVSPLVLDRAEEVIRKTALRTLDALHLASALVFQAVSGVRIEFITSDSRQRDAAARLALQVAWVG